MKEIFLTLAIPVLLVLTGCSHNVVTYGDGIGFDMGVDPEHFSASFTLRYGKTLGLYHCAPSQGHQRRGTVSSSATTLGICC